MTRTGLAFPLALAVIAAAAVPAAAGTSTTPTPTTTTPAPTREGGRMAIGFEGGLATRGGRFYQRGQTVVVVGRVTNFVAGQVAEVSVLRSRRAAATHRARITRAGNGRGRFVVRFRANRRGALRIVAKHTETAEQVGMRAASKRIDVVSWSAGSGAHGTRVLLLQRGLLALGYAVPLNGRYDGGTERAVLAYRKVNLLGRNGFASNTVFRRVFAGQGAYRLRHRGPGRKHVEFDWSRQVLVLARNGRPFRTYHVSSGAPATPTVFGTYRFYMKQPGTNAKGMVHSSYFIGGYAIHGYASVPNYPASHGCIRVPIPSALSIFREVEIGETIYTYR
jgi:hypothetical protein